MNYRDAYQHYIYANNVLGSNKAGSYLKALEYLSLMMAGTPLFGSRDFWTVASTDQVHTLYAFALENQSKDGSIFLQEGFPPSYGRNRYYSAALRSYGQFLVTHHYEEMLWDAYQAPNLDAGELAGNLMDKKVSSCKAFEDEDIFDGKAGRDVQRVVTNRLGQDFFRKMILHEYGSRCCVTGLDLPTVLRASHIVGWAKDKKNRLNPANGLCLSATYDAAFDKHLISFDEKYRLVLSPSLSGEYSSAAFKQYFLDFEGMPMSKPTRFLPDQKLLEKHRSHLK